MCPVQSCIQVIGQGGHILFKVASIPQWLRLAGIAFSGQVVQDWDSHVASEINTRLNKKRHLESLDSLTDTDNLFGDIDTPSELNAGSSQPSTMGFDPSPDILIDQPINIEFQTQPSRPQSAASLSVGVASDREDTGLSLALDTLPRWGNRELKTIRDLAQKGFQEQKMFLQSLALKDIEKHYYQQLARVRHMSDELAQSRKTTRAKNQRIRRLESRLVKAQSDLVETGEGKSLDIIRKGRRLTWRTSIVLGLRKLMCIVSASSFPLCTLTYVSRWTVTRCEVLAWAVLMGRVCSWHHTVLALLKYVTWYLKTHSPQMVSDAMVPTSEVKNAKPQKTVQMPATIQSQDDAIRKDHLLPTEDEWVSRLIATPDSTAYGATWSGVIGCTFFASDATNSSIWQRKKLQGLEVRSMVLVDRRALQSEDYQDAFRTMKCMHLD